MPIDKRTRMVYASGALEMMPQRACIGGEILKEESFLKEESMRQGIGVVLVLVLLLIGAGIFVATAVSLRSSATASAATFSIQPAASSGDAISAPAEQAQPMDGSTTLSASDAERQDVTFFRADHQGVCDGDKSTSTAGY
jgi:hypothetical protein